MVAEDLGRMELRGDDERTGTDPTIVCFEVSCNFSFDKQNDQSTCY